MLPKVAPCTIMLSVMFLHGNLKVIHINEIRILIATTVYFDALRYTEKKH